MDFGAILDQWEQQTQKPYGKKRIKEEAKKNNKDTIIQDNTKTIGDMEFWLRRYGVYDKDAEQNDESNTQAVVAEKRKLRSMKPQAEIDLHGMNLEETEALLYAFFEEAVSKGLKKILIIHGKGNHSQEGPVLSHFVRKFLETHPHAGETGHPKARCGGSGSTWVILK